MRRIFPVLPPSFGLRRGRAGLARCACCAPRHQIAQALAKLFFARARGEVAFFRQVVVIGADETAIRAAVADDVVTAARYRIASSG